MLDKSQAVIFRTPGLLDLMAVTTFGINSKPNTDSPIGYFGTGLKYAIAVLCRERIPVTVWIGKTPYHFFSQHTKFRDKEFDVIMMRTIATNRGGIDRVKSWWSTERLPFTTQLGKNWDLWQAFRELESNTRDENGVTYLVKNPDLRYHPAAVTTSDGKDWGEYNRTYICVYSARFADYYHKRDEIFLSPQETPRAAKGNDGHTWTVDVYDRPSKYLYYRGMRVYDFPDDMQSIQTYNIKQTCELTEDRTLKHQWLAKSVIAQHIMHSADRSLLFKVLTAPPKSFEASLEFDALTWVDPSQEFVSVGKELHTQKVLKGGAGAILPRVEGYFVNHVIPLERATQPGRPLSARVESWLTTLEGAYAYPEFTKLVRQEVLPILTKHEDVERIRQHPEMTIVPDEIPF